MWARHRGFTLIEILVVLMIAAMLLIGVTAMIDTSLEDTKAQQAALHQDVFSIAAAKYLASHYAELSASPGPTAIRFDEVSTPELFALLPLRTTLVNGYQQTPCLIVRTYKRGEVNVIDGLVVNEGGQEIPARALPFSAAHAGIGGGYIYKDIVDSVVKALGASGSWKLDNTTVPSLTEITTPSCTGISATTGSLLSALFFDGPGKAEDFLYRNAAPAGMEKLNTMNTPLLMDKAAIDLVVGSECGEKRAVAFDQFSNLLICKNSSWQRASGSWRDPVDTYEDLYADIDGPALVGDVRVVKASGLPGSIGHAFTFDGTSWTALAVDQLGDMNIPHNLTVGNNASVTNDFAVNHDAELRHDLTVGRNADVANDLTVANDANVSVDLKVGGEIRAGGDISSTNGNLSSDAGMVTAYAGGFYGQTVTIGEHHKLDDPCHQPLPPDKFGKINYRWPIGTIVLDHGGDFAKPPPSIPLICSGTDETDAKWVYFNGNLTP